MNDILRLSNRQYDLLIENNDFDRTKRRTHRPFKMSSVLALRYIASPVSQCFTQDSRLPKLDSLFFHF